MFFRRKNKEEAKTETQDIAEEKPRGFLSLFRDSAVPGLSRSNIIQQAMDRTFRVPQPFTDILKNNNMPTEIMAMDSSNKLRKRNAKGETPLERAHFIAWSLHGDYEERLAEKKKTLRIKE